MFFSECFFGFYFYLDFFFFSEHGTKAWLMWEAPTRLNPRGTNPRHRKPQGTLLAQEKKEDPCKSKTEAEKDQEERSEKSGRRQEGNQRPGKAGRASLTAKVQATNVDMRLRYLQPTKPYLVLWMWWSLYLLPILCQAKPALYQNQAEQISMEEKREGTRIEGECTDTVWHLEGALGHVDPGEDDIGLDSCAKLSIQGEERRKGEGQKRRSPGAGGVEAARPCLDGGRGPRGASRPTEEVDQRRARDHPWRREKDEEIQGTSEPIQRRTGLPRSEVERIQKLCAEELGAAERDVSRKEVKPGGTTERGKTKVGRPPEGSEGQNSKDSGIGRGKRIRGRRQGGRRPRGPALGRRGGGERGRRTRGGRGHDSGRLGKWEKGQIATSLWRKETPEKVKEEGSGDRDDKKDEWNKIGEASNPRDEVCKRIKEAPIFQGADSLWVKVRNAPRFQGSYPTLQDSNKHKRMRRRDRTNEAPFQGHDSRSKQENEDSMKPEGQVTGTRPKYKRHEESRDLEELRVMVRMERRAQDEERWQEADEQLQREGGDDLRQEILGLLDQDAEEDLPIWIYVLGQVHEDTIYTRKRRGRQESPQDVVGWIIQEVRRRTRVQEGLDVIYVTPQPPPHWRRGEDALHAIVDIRPELAGTPVLMASMFGDGADEDHPELGADRSGQGTTCYSILRKFGKLHLCAERFRRCSCYHEYLDKGERQALYPRKGDRIDLRIRGQDSSDEEEDEMTFLQNRKEEETREEEEKEECSLMLARNLRRQRYNTAYAYVFEESEPRYFVGLRLDKHEYKWHVFETIMSSPSKPIGKKYEVYEVKPNPPDLESKGIQGYVLEEAGARAQTQSAVLLDFEVLPNEAITMQGDRIFREEWRTVERVQERTTRTEFLQELQVWQLCKKPGSCLLTMGGKPWREQDADIWWLMDGTYGIVRILNQAPEVPVNCQTKWAQENFEVEEFEKKWKKERDKKRRRSEEDEEDETEQSSMLQTAMTQRNRPSVARLNMSRLPPPGNGKVTFDDKIICQDKNGKQQRRDKAISNEFVEGMWKSMKEEADNPFIKAFRQGLRYEDIEEVENKEDEEEEDEEGEEERRGYLPLIETGKEDEEPIDEGGSPEEPHNDPEGNQGLRKQEDEEGRKIQIHRDGDYERWDEKESHEEGMDFGPVIRFAEWLNAHMTIPSFEVEGIPWKKESRQWIWLPVWQSTKILEAHLYTDGSVSGSTGGSAAILFVVDEEGWKFGGYLMNWEEEDAEGGGINAYQMEMDAMMMALKWSHDIIKLHLFNYGTQPDIHIHFDSYTAGYGTAGEYKGNQSDTRYVAARSLHQAISIGLRANINISHEKAHRGNPGNEAADTLAQQAQKVKRRRDNMMKSIGEGNGSWCIQWLWWLYRGDVWNYMEGDKLRIPKVKNEIDKEVLKTLEREEVKEKSEEEKKVHLKLFTYNVNTLKGKDKGIGGIGSIEATLKILHEEGVHIAVFQETRLRRRLGDGNRWFHLHQEEANNKGQGGILIAISKVHPIDDNGTLLRKDEVRYVEGYEERMILKVRNQTVRFALVVGHAPHAGYDEKTICQWWDNTTQILEKCCQGWDVISALDANAKTGGKKSDQIGDFQEEGENIPGYAFHQCLAASHQWVPATFQRCQRGQGKTITYPNGNQARLDYICLPDTWKNAKVESQVRDDLSNRDTLYDHRPVVVEVQMKIWGEGKKKGPRKKPRFNIKEEDKRKAFRQHLEAGARSFPWDMNIHTHVHRVNQVILDAAREAEKLEKTKQMMKEYLKEDTWEAIQRKKEVRKRCFEEREKQRLGGLREIFEAWKTGQGGAARQDEDWKQQIREEQEFRVRSREVTRLVRRDDRDFFDGLAQQMKEKEETKEVAGLWRCVKRHIPKWKNRKKARDPGKNEDLDKKWDQHMKRIEAAKPRETTEVYKKCVARQNEEEESHRPLNTIPTLLQVEQALRESKAGRCGGKDDILPDWLHFAANSLGPLAWEITFKSFAWGEEAVQHKGGRLIMIDKQMNSKEPEGYRPIMLLSAMGRRVHALMRKELMGELQKEKRRGQLGGFSGQEPTFGSHFTRTIVRTAQAQGISSGVIYLDLKSAYHSMVRQAVLEESTQEEARREEAEEVLDNIREAGGNEEEVKKRITQKTYLERLGTPKYIRRHLHEIGESNWADLYDRQYQTFKGTRPGSPMADAIFHVTMAEIQGELQEAMEGQEESTKAYQKIQIEGSPITWADDVSMVILASDVGSLDSMVEEITTQANNSFRRRGMELNYKKAKSEVMMSLTGQGAGGKRRRLLTGEEGDHHIRQEDDKSNTLKTVGRYKHLGTMHQAGGGMDEEIKYRCEQAWAAWRPLARQIFKSKYLRVQTRLDLLNSLVFTRLFYGAGSWPTLRVRLSKKIETTMMKMIREVMDFTTKKGGEHWSDRWVLMKAKLPDARARIAKERLTYGQRFFNKAEDFMQEAVHREDDVRTDSWLAALRSDLRWFKDVTGEGVEDIEEMKKRWKKYRGWKREVKKALRRHVAQEGVSLRIENRLKTEGVKTGEGDEELDEVWKCECGTQHKSKAGLAAHRRLVHNIHGEEYEFGGQTRCLVCMKELWSIARFRQHVGYMPRRGRTNRCFCIYKAMQLKDEADKEEIAKKMETLKGINRRESIVVAGPKICGYDKNDKKWLEEATAEAEEKVKGKLNCTLDELYEDGDWERCEAKFQEDGLNGVIEYLDGERKGEGWQVFQLAFWGKLRDWERADDMNEWKELVRCHEGGDELLTWAQRKGVLTLLDLADRIQPHKNPNLAVSSKERHKKDEEVPRHLRGLAELCTGRAWAERARSVALSHHISVRKLERLVG